MIIIILFYLLYNKKISNQIQITNENIINISFCFFDNIYLNSQNGAIFINNNNCETFLNFWTFFKINGFNGGAIFFLIKIGILKNLCFHSCNGSCGSSIYQHKIFENQLNYIIILNNYVLTYSTWNLGGGPTNIFSINTSICISFTREVSGHFGNGPFCNSKYYIIHNNIGPGIFGPYSINPGNNLHEFCTFYNNSCDYLGILVIWDGIHHLINSNFIKNIVLITSS